MLGLLMHGGKRDKEWEESQYIKTREADGKITEM